MNKVREIAKFILCMGIITGAPFIAAAVIDFVTIKIENQLKITSCERATALNKVSTVCR